MRNYYLLISFLLLIFLNSSIVLCQPNNPDSTLRRIRPFINRPMRLTDLPESSKKQSTNYDKLISWFSKQKFDTLVLVNKGKYHIDFLLPVFKELISQYISSNKTRNSPQSDDLKNPKFLSLYNELLRYTNADSVAFSKVKYYLGREINRMPNNRGKAYLSIFYADTYIKTHKKYDNYSFSYASSVGDIAEKCSDKYQKVQIYELLGDFYRYHGEYEKAIDAYYDGLIVSWKIDELLTIRLLDNIHVLYLSQNVSISTLRARQILDILYSASLNYSDTLIAWENRLKLISIDNFQLNTFQKSRLSKAEYEEYQHEDLLELKYWYETFYLYGSPKSVVMDYVAFYTLGSIFLEEGKYNISRYYFIRSLFNALMMPANHIGKIHRSLFGISNTYALEGDIKRAIEYINLSVSFAMERDDFAYYASLLEKAQIYRNVNSIDSRFLDSALYYANYVERDVIGKTISPINDARLMEYWAGIKRGVYLTKYNQATSNGHLSSNSLKDSIFKYTDLEQNLIISKLDFVANMLSVESGKLITFTKNYSDQLINTEREKVLLLEKNVRLEANERARVTKEMRTQDSLNTLKLKAIEFEKSLLKKEDSLSKEKSKRIIAENKSIVAQKEAVTKQKQTFLVALISVVIISAVTISLNKKRSAEESKSAKLKIANAELTLTNAQMRQNVIKSRSHEIKALVSSINHRTNVLASLLNDKSRANDSEINNSAISLLRLTQKSDRYVQTYYNSLINTNSNLKEEFDLSFAFKNVYEEEYEISDQKITLVNEVREEPLLTKIVIPPHFITNFVMNSIRHGMDGVDTIKITWLSELIQGGYRLIIDDTGCGINKSKEKSKNWQTRSSGLKNAVEAANLYNQCNYEYKMVFDESHIIDKHSEMGLPGTRIIIDFIKA